METKWCGSCKKFRSIDDFAVRNTKTGLRQSWCRSCRAIYDKSRYNDLSGKEKSRLKQKNKNIRVRNRKFIWNYLSKHPCVDCGESDPAVLDFDHQKDKKYDVCNMFSHALVTLKQEIAKCEIRCANCHRRRTATQQGWYKDFNGM